MKRFSAWQNHNIYKWVGTVVTVTALTFTTGMTYGTANPASANDPNKIPLRKHASSSPSPWYDAIYHDSWNTFYRSPFGADPTGQPVLLRLLVPQATTSASIILSDINNNFSATASIPMHLAPVSLIKATGKSGSGKSLWEGVIPAKDVSVPGILYYVFQVKMGSKTAYYGNNGSGYGGIGQAALSSSDLINYHITVYAHTFTTPNWLVHGIIYEIFPDRFYNGNKANDENPKTQKGIGSGPNGQEQLVPIYFHKNWNSTPFDPNVLVNIHSKNYQNEKKIYGTGQWGLDYYGGDLRGIIDKLGYLKSLGVNTLYLTPIFKADSNHKYNTGNFFQIDPGFGTLKTFKELMTDTKKLGMHVILDGVFEDTGSNSVYFNKFGTYPGVGAWQQHQNSKKVSPYYNWYEWNPAGSPPYQGWGGVDTLPLTNTQNKGWQQFVYGKSSPSDPTNPAKNSVARYWLSVGASGWRLDSANNSNFSVAWWSAFRNAVKKTNPHAAIIGEDWNDPTNDNGTDWLTGTTWDSTMNYPFRNAVISFFRGSYNDGNVQNFGMNATQFNDTLMQMMETYPKPAMYAMMNLFGSHDTERILTILEGAPNVSSVSAYQQATWTPSPAQQALGVKKLELAADFQYGFVGVPMIYYGDEAGMIGYKDPLDRGTYPWGHVNQTLINHFILLGSIRNQHPVLQSGEYTPLYAQGSAYAFARTVRNHKDALGMSANNATAIVAINNGSARTLTIAVSSIVPNGTLFTDALNHNKKYTVVHGKLIVPLSDESGAILFPQN